MPKASSLPRLSRNLYVFGRAALDFWHARGFLDELVRTVRSRIDLVHFNHEALFLLARWLRPRTSVPFVMHLRTNLYENVFSRWQEAVIGRAVDQRVFITPNEEDSYRRLGGTGPGKVIYNIVRSVPETMPLEAIPRDDRFRVAAISNYSWPRGTDRLIDVAEILLRRGRRDILFVVAGDNRVPRNLPGELGRVGHRGGTLADYAAARGVGNYFLFLGHVSKPEQVIAACHAVAKPTRENNPWGRDVLEAAAQSRLVLSVGKDQTFIENNQTGILFDPFDAEKFAAAIIAAADDRGWSAALGAAAQKRVLALCDGEARARDLLQLWQEARR